jgi:transposase-like protein
MDLQSQIRALISDALARGRNVKEIATDAGVPYDRLYKWWSERTQSLDVNDADAIHLLLAGRRLS